jgi:hypothetical protein
MSGRVGGGGMNESCDFRVFFVAMNRAKRKPSRPIYELPSQE